MILEELAKYKDMNPEALRESLSQRWIIEKGLEAGAELIFEIADHILSSQFVHYADTYEDTLRALFEEGVISEELYLQIKGPRQPAQHPGAPLSADRSGPALHELSESSKDIPALCPGDLGVVEANKRKK